MIGTRDGLAGIGGGDLHWGASDNSICTFSKLTNELCLVEIGDTGFSGTAGGMTGFEIGRDGVERGDLGNSASSKSD